MEEFHAHELLLTAHIFDRGQKYDILCAPNTTLRDIRNMVRDPSKSIAFDSKDGFSLSSQDFIHDNQDIVLVREDTVVLKI